MCMAHALFYKKDLKDVEIIFYILIFCMGTVFGSFFTLAVYRIPLGLDITHERSFCPNCEHKLGFKDLIPIFSYISLKGKCRYCGKHIRIRYLFLEVLSGIVFLLSYLSFKINFPFFEMEKIIDFIAFVLFYVTLVIILGIDKENKTISKKVLLFGILTNFLYIVYLYISKGKDMYRYGMYLGIMLFIFILDTILLSKRTKSFYFLQILMLIVYILMYVDSWLIIPIILFSILYEFLYYIYMKIKSVNYNTLNILDEPLDVKIPFGFCISISSIMIIILNNFIVL